MRIVSMTVALMVTLTVISTRSASADTATTNTNININTNISNAISFATTQNNPFFVDLSMANFSQETTPIKTPAEIQYEQTLEKWKVKQQTLWSSLPENAFTINASAYTAAADECGNSKGITASGIKVQEQRTLACPSIYPFGAKISIEGYGIFTCEDRGGAIKGNHFDIYMKTKQEAFAFGRRNLTAQVIQ